MSGEIGENLMKTFRILLDKPLINLGDYGIIFIRDMLKTL